MNSNCRTFLPSLLCCTALWLVTAGGANAASFVVSNRVELQNAIQATKANGEANVIRFSGDIVLDAVLPVVGDDSTDDLTIDLNGFSLSGGNATRLIFANAGTLRIVNGSLVDGLAKGGNGGSADGYDSGAGGGGMGAGGALFVRAGTTVELDLVSFGGNTAAGGSGGGIHPVFLDGGAGGGGGLGGDGGFGGGVRNGTIPGGGGGGGGALPGQNGSDGSNVGGNGGGSNGGTGSNVAGTSGGDLSGGAGGGSGGAGGDGGFGGGGGGIYDLSYVGGDGGFGGGGGGAASLNAGGSGGFGGGSGGALYGTDGSYQSGFGGGRGSTDRSGGGGAAFGGAVFVQDGGLLVIRGAGTMSGGAVTAGAAGGAGSTAGQAQGTGIFLQNATIEFAPEANQTQVIGDVIADDFGNPGSTGGKVRKTGAGILHLDANNTYVGQTDVEAGSLLVNGATTGSTFVVSSTGRLGGNGTVGATTIGSGGTLAPGNSIGTLRFANGLNFAPGSTFEVEVKSGGNTAGVHNDLTEVTGTTTIDATSRVRVLAENGTDDGSTYAQDTTYTILTSAGGVSGMFNSSVDENFAFLDAALTYDLNAVYLTLRRNSANFATAATTPNQQGAANALNSFGTSDPVYQQIAAQSSADAQNSFNSASGEAHASGQHVVDQTFALFSSAQGHGGGATAQVGVASMLAVDETASVAVPKHSLWLTPLAGRGTINTNGNAAKLDWWSAGLAGGYEVGTAVNGGDGRFGLSLGYMRGGGEVIDRRSTLTNEGIYAGLHGAWSDGPLSLSGNIGYGAAHVHTERTIVIGPMQSTASADYWSQTFGTSLEAAYGFALTDSFTVSPVGTLDVAWSGHGGATETGAGALNATIDPTSAWRLDVGLGVELAYVLDLDNGASVTLKGRAMWEHAFGDTAPDQTITLAGGGGAFTVSGTDSGRDRLIVGTGLAWSPSASTTISLDYNGTFSGSQAGHTASASVKVSF